MTSFARSLITDDDARRIDVLLGEAQGYYAMRVVSDLMDRLGIALSAGEMRKWWSPRLMAAQEEAIIAALSPDVRISDREASMTIYLAQDRDAMWAALAAHLRYPLEEVAIAARGEWPLHRDDLQEWEFMAYETLGMVIAMTPPVVAAGEYDRALGMIAYVQEGLHAPTFAERLEAADVDDRRCLALLFAACAFENPREPNDTALMILLAVERPGGVAVAVRRAARARMAGPAGDAEVLRHDISRLADPPPRDEFVRGVDLQTWTHLAGRVLQAAPRPYDDGSHYVIPLDLSEWVAWRDRYEASPGWLGWRVMDTGRYIYMIGDVGYVDDHGVRRSIGAAYPLRVEEPSGMYAEDPARVEWVVEQVAKAVPGFSARDLGAMSVTVDIHSFRLTESLPTEPNAWPRVTFAEALVQAPCTHDVRVWGANQGTLWRGWMDARVAVCATCGMSHLEVIPIDQVPGAEMPNGPAYRMMEQFYAAMSTREGFGAIVCGDAPAAVHP